MKDFCSTVITNLFFINSNLLSFCQWLCELKHAKPFFFVCLFVIVVVIFSNTCNTFPFFLFDNPKSTNVIIMYKITQYQSFRLIEITKPNVSIYMNVNFNAMNILLRSNMSHPDKQSNATNSKIIFLIQPTKSIESKMFNIKQYIKLWNVCGYFSIWPEMNTWKIPTPTQAQHTSNSSK